jgi:hypothetical protein
LTTIAVVCTSISKQELTVNVLSTQQICPRDGVA